MKSHSSLTGRSLAVKSCSKFSYQTLQNFQNQKYMQNLLKCIRVTTMLFHHEKWEKLRDGNKRLLGNFLSFSNFFSFAVREVRQSNDGKYVESIRMRATFVIEINKLSFAQKNLLESALLSQTSQFSDLRIYSKANIPQWHKFCWKFFVCTRFIEKKAFSVVYLEHSKLKHLFASQRKLCSSVWRTSLWLFETMLAWIYPMEILAEG